MTEAEWLKWRDPLGLIDYLYTEVSPSDRKFRLFCCAACRLVWDILPHEASRAAVQVAERFADGDATTPEREQAWTAAFDLAAALVRDSDGFPNQPLLRAAWAAAEVAEEVEPWWSVCDEVATATGRTPSALQSQADLLRCIVGNPFRPVAFAPEWRSDTAVALARGIYDDRAWDRLPVLADALDDAGCDHPDVLAHLRGPGPHARGCWVVDAVLGLT